MIPKKYNMMKYAFVLVAFIVACLSVHAQEPETINGSVFDYLSLTPVASANVSVKGEVGMTTETSDAGVFKIQSPSRYAVLVISKPGYQVKEYPLFGNKEVTIHLIPEGLEFGESNVRLPYAVTNEKDLNGAYSVISKSYDKTIQYRDIYQMLEGVVPGLQVNAISGIPGEGSRLNIRGTRSLYAGNEPLLVVDGVPIINQTFENSVVKGNIYNYLADINVKDIESVTVLRDASAVGIYGSRASNGAIVITTKQGTNGKSFLDVSVQQGMSLRYDEMPVMNGEEYLSYLSNRLYEQGLDQQAINENFSFFTNTDKNSVEYWTYNNNTNWQKEVSQNALSQDYYLNLRGGDVTSKYSLHAGYRDNEGVIKGVSNERFTSRFNLDFRISSKLTAGMRMGFSRTTKNLMDQGYEERTNPFYLGLVKPAIFAPFEKSNQGHNTPFLSQPGFDLISNPTAVVAGVQNEVINTWMLGSVYTLYEFSKSLKTKVTLSIDRKGLEEDRFTPANGLVPLNNDFRFDRTSEEQLVVDRVMSVEHTLIYDKLLNQENHIGAMIGYNFESSDFESNYGYTIHASSDEFQGLGDGSSFDHSGINESYKNVSFFTNIDYTFREKIFLKAGLRLDGSSRFGDQVDEGVQIGSVPFAFLPYTGLTWKVKGEPWMKDFTAVDDLNVRASWGITANQNIPINARYSLYGTQFYGDRPGFAPTSLGNPYIKWEITNNYNFGIDISLWKKSIGVSLDYYATKTTDLLLPITIDGSNGVNQYWGNAGIMKNNGVELGLNTFGHSSDLIWNVNLSIAKNINEVSDLPNGMPIIDGNNGFSSIVSSGDEAGLIYGYENLGVFSSAAEASTAGLLNDNGLPYQAGDFHFADLNGDGIISGKDMLVIGNPNPEFFGGIKAGIGYENFALDAAFTYSYGNDILNVLRMKLETAPGYENQSIAVLDRWKKDGDVTSIPGSKYGDPAGNRKPSSNYIEDGSYLKMKSLTLSYNFNEQISFIRSAQVYLTAYNLFTLTNYLGWDPELALGQGIFTRGYDFGNNPTPRMFMLGIKLSL